MNDYVLKVGGDGSERLDALDEHLGPYSRRFLLDAGLARGLRVLDLGCGNGNLTRWMAQVVGPEGSVVAADADKRQLDLVQAAVNRCGIRNVEVVPTDAEHLDLSEGEFDLAYSRCLLMHLREPGAALQGLYGVVRRGGVVACEEPASSSIVTWPDRVEVIHALNRAFVAMGRARSLDFDIGDRLYGLMVRPGMTVVTARFVQPVVPLSIAAAFLELGAREMRQVAIRSGVISQLDADAAVAALVGLTRSREGYYAFPREAQVAVQLA